MSNEFKVGSDAAGQWLKKNDPKSRKLSRRQKKKRDQYFASVTRREQAAQRKLAREANKKI